MTFRTQKHFPVYGKHSHGHFKCNEVKQVPDDRVQGGAYIKAQQMWVKVAVRCLYSLSTSA